MDTGPRAVDAGAPPRDVDAGGAPMEASVRGFEDVASEDALPLADVVPSGMACRPADAGMPVASALAKVKELLCGEVPTAAEVRAVELDPAAIEGLVDAWTARPGHRVILRRFFASAFQQDDLSYQEFAFQFGEFHPLTANESDILRNVRESFARTAMSLVDEGRPFTETMTTRRFAMTTALLATYAMRDVVAVDDGFNRTDLFPVRDPVRIVLQSDRVIPLERSVDRASPDFMTFTHPGIATPYQDGCPTRRIEYPSPAGVMALEGIVLSHTPLAIPGTNCVPPPLAPADRAVQPSDFDDWRMVTFRTPRAGEATTPFYAVPALRTATEVVLDTPRVGFFTTLAFFGRWQTNTSNQARVLLNQTMIVGLGAPMDAANPSAPADLAALDATHAAPGTPCYGCHVALDPMRQIFRATYTLYGSVQGASVQRAMHGQFAFHGSVQADATIFDLGDRLAAHPMFAEAWAQRVCTWANSVPCDPHDPDFVAAVSRFRSSGFAWPVLMRAVFGSALVTGLARPASSMPPVPVARTEALCALLSARLGVDDACGIDVGAPFAGSVTRTLTGTWPSQRYSRGSVLPSLTVAPTMMLRGGLESLCVDLAARFVDGPDTRFPSADAAASVYALTTRLLGLDGVRAAPVRTVLREHYDSARAVGATPVAAMRSTFVLACLSPYVAGVGM